MKKIILLGFILGTILVIHGCQKDPSVIDIDDAPYNLEYGTFPTPNIPEDNPLTREGVQLGRMLFYEKMLSGNNTQSCGSCHLQAFAFTDTAKLSIGIRGLPGKRQAMSIFNMAWHGNEFFWDGRAHLLRDQSIMPIQDELEMDESLENVVSKLKENIMYRVQFKKAFGSEEINAEKISLALEQFMHSIVSNNSKYDQFLAGNASLSIMEERGRKLFFTEYNPFFPDSSGADCAHCHGGNNFENDLYMNNGLDNDGQVTDIGREAVTNNPQDKALFKVTSLRNIELTAPYMHDGRFSTLEQVVEHYNLVQPSNTLDPALSQQLPHGGLKLTQEDKDALVAFLKTLTDQKLITNQAHSNPFN